MPICSGWSELASAATRGRKQVQMLVAYGIGRDGRRHLLAFLRSQGEGQADWEALLQDLYRRGLEGQALDRSTDGCAGLAAAIRTVYPRVRHQRCWVHKMRNILEKARKRDYDDVKTGAQAITWPNLGLRQKPHFAVSARVGSGRTGRWCADWNATCRNCCRSSLFLGTCGANCAPPM